MTPRPPQFHNVPDAPILTEAVDLGNIPAPVLRAERDDLLGAVEAHMAEMDMCALKPGRDRDDIDNDLYNVATRIRETSGPAPDFSSIASPIESVAEVHDDQVNRDVRFLRKPASPSTPRDEEEER